MARGQKVTDCLYFGYFGSYTKWTSSLLPPLILSVALLVAKNKEGLIEANKANTNLSGFSD